MNLLKKFFLCATVFFLIPQAVFAQENTISVTPSIIQLDLASDKPEATITYTNTRSNDIEITLHAENVKILEEGYKMSFLQGKDQSNYTYGLFPWVDFEKKNLLIHPHTAESTKVFIAADKLTPGGHYASIVAYVVEKSPASGNVQITSQLASLLFVRTNTGKEQEEAHITSFSNQQDTFFSFPKTSFFRLENTGDVDVIPYGLLTVTDMFGNVVAKAIVNENSLQTLPESIRRYNLDIHGLSPLLLPQVYKATLSIHFGKQQKNITQTVQFFSQGNLPIIQILGLLVVIGIIVFVRSKKKRKRKPYQDNVIQHLHLGQ